MPKPEQYIGIWEWGMWMQSFPPFIRAEQKKAAAANAPLDAIFENYSSAGAIGTWSTVSELKQNHEFRERYEAAVKLAREINA